MALGPELERAPAVMPFSGSDQDASGIIRWKILCTAAAAGHWHYCKI
jgi:hypothetical protein